MMETTAQFSFQGSEPNEATRRAIREHVTKLERKFGRITACHVNLTAPGEHHRTGGLYQVHIRLALPGGREVNVTHSPTADERHADLPFAINDAFHRAQRQLQDQVRVMQGQTKTLRGGPPTG